MELVHPQIVPYLNIWLGDFGLGVNKSKNGASDISSRRWANYQSIPKFDPQNVITKSPLMEKVAISDILVLGGCSSAS